MDIARQIRIHIFFTGVFKVCFKDRTRAGDVVVLRKRGRREKEREGKDSDSLHPHIVESASSMKKPADQQRNAERIPLSEPIPASIESADAKIVELSLIGAKIEHFNRLSMNSTASVQ